MSTRLWTLLLGLLLLVAALPSLAMAGPSAAGAPDHSSGLSAASAYPTLKGNITGPGVVGTGANQRYLIQASGGPATAPNGTIVGNLTYYASVNGANLTGVQITPTSAAIVAGAPGRPLLEAGTVPQTLTIAVELVSVLNTTNVTLNLTLTVQVVQPYTLSAVILNPNNATVAAFPIIVDLDGAKVGNVSAPNILPFSEYNFSFEYASINLSTGWHTFSISLTQEHGLVRFANGSTVYTASFYVPGPAPDYTIWYVTGVVAFVGVLFILAARLGARRRNPTKK